MTSSSHPTASADLTLATFAANLRYEDIPAHAMSFNAPDIIAFREKVTMVLDEEVDQA